MSAGGVGSDRVCDDGHHVSSFRNRRYVRPPTSSARAGSGDSSPAAPFADAVPRSRRHRGCAARCGTSLDRSAGARRALGHRRDRGRSPARQRGCDMITTRSRSRATSPPTPSTSARRAAWRSRRSASRAASAATTGRRGRGRTPGPTGTRCRPSEALADHAYRSLQQGRSRHPDRAPAAAGLGHRHPAGDTRRDRRRGDRPRPAVGHDDVSRRIAGAVADGARRAAQGARDDAWAAPGVDASPIGPRGWESPSPSLVGAEPERPASSWPAARRRSDVSERSGWRALDSPRAPTPRALRARSRSRAQRRASSWRSRRSCSPAR